MKATKLTKAAVVLLPLVLAACNPRMNFAQGTQSSDNFNSNGPISKDDQVPFCEINLPQVVLNGNVNSFEFGSSVAFMFGYNKGGAHTGVGGSVNVKISKANLDLSMDATDPMTGLDLVSPTEQTADQTGTGIGGEIDFSKYQTGVDWYKSTPLHEVTDKGMLKAVTQLQKELDTPDFQSTWIARVIQQETESTVVINAGSTAGLVKGDEFYVYNVKHIWQDPSAPCHSNYRMSYRDPQTPVATIHVDSVGPGNSLAHIVSKTASIRLGAEVQVKQLVAAAPKTSRYLKKIAQIGHITAKAFTVPGADPNATPFDFEGVMNEQIKEILFNNGFALLQ